MRTSSRPTAFSIRPETHRRHGRAAVHLGLAVLAAALSSCSADVTRFGKGPTHAAECRPGTFIGTMTINCPQPVR